MLQSLYPWLRCRRFHFPSVVQGRVYRAYYSRKMKMQIICKLIRPCTCICKLSLRWKKSIVDFSFSICSQSIGRLIFHLQLKGRLSAFETSICMHIEQKLKLISCPPPKVLNVKKFPMHDSSYSGTKTCNENSNIPFLFK